MDFEENGYYVSIQVVSEYFGAISDMDACGRLWGVQDDTHAAWSAFLPFPYQLNTDITLHRLSALLIVNCFANATDCPSGGLGQSLDWPNGCGLQRTAAKMIEWQNQYDEATFWKIYNRDNYQQAKQRSRVTDDLKQARDRVSEAREELGNAMKDLEDAQASYDALR